MTTKFSRNRAKVQPTPKVCKSAPPRPSNIPVVTWPATIAISSPWNISFNMMQFSTMITGASCAHMGGGVYVGTANDTSGRTWTFTVNMPIGSAASITISCPTFGASPDQLFGNDGTWPGTRPYTFPSQLLSKKAGIFGAPTWQITGV